MVLLHDLSEGSFILETVTQKHCFDLHVIFVFRF